MSSVAHARLEKDQGPGSSWSGVTDASGPARSRTVRLPRITRPADHPLMTVREAAERLGCSDMTIRRRIAARQFPAVRNGRKSMIPRSFIERLLAQAEAGRTVVVDEAVQEWRAEASDLQAQAGPGRGER
jgi:excisionase family DNA binding protein